MTPDELLPPPRERVFSQGDPNAYIMYYYAGIPRYRIKEIEEYNFRHRTTLSPLEAWDYIKTHAPPNKHDEYDDPEYGLIPPPRIFEEVPLPDPQIVEELPFPRDERGFPIGPPPPRDPNVIVLPAGPPRGKPFRGQSGVTPNDPWGRGPQLGDDRGAPPHRPEDDLTLEFLGMIPAVKGYKIVSGVLRWAFRAPEPLSGGNNPPPTVQTEVPPVLIPHGMGGPLPFKPLPPMPNNPPPQPVFPPGPRPR